MPRLALVPHRSGFGNKCRYMCSHTIKDIPQQMIHTKNSSRGLPRNNEIQIWLSLVLPGLKLDHITSQTKLKIQLHIRSPVEQLGRLGSMFKDLRGRYENKNKTDDIIAACD